MKKGKKGKRRYPVYYEKSKGGSGYRWSWRYGDFDYDLLPDVSEVIAYIVLPDPYDESEAQCEWTELKIGDKVIMNDKYHVSKKNKGKVFTVTSGPWDCRGTVLVRLGNYKSGYAVD